MSMKQHGVARFADRLDAARHQRFWGRARELELFESELAAGSRRFSVLYVHGLGGVGKSSLLREYGLIAAKAGYTVVHLDGRLVDPSPGGFLIALRDDLQLEAAQSPLDSLRGHDRVVLMLDSYELLAPLDAWLRQRLLPQLPAGAFVVVAGRHPPSADWTADLGWAPMLKTIELRNLGPDESRLLLRDRCVPDAQHSSVLDFTHGHPLALVLVADVIANRDPEVPFSPGHAPNVVRALIERLVAGAPSAAHRRAIELCAHVRVTTEALLGVIVEGADPHELFEWLRGLSFIEHGAEGIFPHDVAREALDADFRWRDPDAYRDMHRRVFMHVRERLRNAAGRAQQRAFFDKLYLHRANPIGAQYHDYGTLGAIYAEPATAGDFAAIVDAVQRHEGDASASIAKHWLRRQPDGFNVIRAAGGGVLGFVATVAVHDPSPRDIEVDPAVRAAWEFVRRRGVVRKGEAMVHHRFHIARDVYQGLSPTINLLATMVTVTPMRHERLAWSFITFAQAEPWLPIMRYINFEPAPDAGFAVGGRRYAVFAHDWRVETFDMWWEREASRSVSETAEPELAGGAKLQAIAVLSQSEFAESVRQGLRDYVRIDALCENPLLRSRAVSEAAAGGAPSAAGLQALLRGAIEQLNRDDRDRKFYRALLYTYIQPAPSQERAAERLGIPFGTYRYHLARGTDRVVAWLWQRELHGSVSEG